MSLFSKCLMKWREPKPQGFITTKNVLAALALALLVSIPFGFVGGHGTYKISSALFGLLFMLAAPLTLILVPLLPGVCIELTDEAIVRKASRRRQKTPYRDIDCIYLYRNSLWNQGNLTIDLNNEFSNSRKFILFEVRLMNESADDEMGLQLTMRNTARRFCVPDSVNVEQVLQIFRDKGVKLVEPKLVPA